MCCSNASCFPIVYLSLCDAKVFLTEFTEEVTLNIYKSNSKICEYTLEPDNGELFLTDLEILDFGNLFHKFVIFLKDSENKTIPLQYTDCDGELQETEKVYLRFQDCETENDSLFQDCY